MFDRFPGEEPFPDIQLELPHCRFMSFPRILLLVTRKSVDQCLPLKVTKKYLPKQIKTYSSI